MQICERCGHKVKIFMKQDGSKIQICFNCDPPITDDFLSFKEINIEDYISVDYDEIASELAYYQNITNQDPDDIFHADISIDNNLLEPSLIQTDNLQILTDIKTQLVNFLYAVDNFLNFNQLESARIVLEQIIKIIPLHKTIPHGRPYATKIEEEFIVYMKKMALCLYNQSYENTFEQNIEKLKKLNWVLKCWLIQTEDELIANLNKSLSTLTQKYFKAIPEYMTPIEAEKKYEDIKKIGEKIKIIRQALKNIDEWGSKSFFEDLELQINNI